jgi:hypothetical protein
MLLYLLPIYLENLKQRYILFNILNNTSFLYHCIEYLRSMSLCHVIIFVLGATSIAFNVIMFILQMVKSSKLIQKFKQDLHLHTDYIVMS